jgi:DNA repair protein SbcD/Mre11
MNLREHLLYTHFLAAIERIIELSPDAIVHAGDLFHHVKPKTRAYTVALQMLDRLHDEGIPLIAIAGNHSMAKTRYTTSPFEVLEFHHASVFAAYSYRYRKVELGDTIFHLIPNMLQPEDYRAAFDGIELSRSATNVLVTHGLSSTLSDKRMHTAAEHEIDATILSDQFDYIALGHFHGQAQVAENAWYSGSLEYCSYGESSDIKGGLIVDTETRAVTHLDLPHTPLIDLGTIACDSSTAADVSREIARKIRERLGPDSGAMCQITLKGIRQETLSEIDQRVIQEARDRTLNFKLRVMLTENESLPHAGTDLGGSTTRRSLSSSSGDSISP